MGRFSLKHYLGAAAIIAWLFLMGNSLAAELKRYESSNGMDTIQVSDGYKMIVPQGMKVKMEGGQVKVEDPTEYIVRRLQSLEDEINQLMVNQSQCNELVSKLTEQEKNDQKTSAELQTFLNDFNKSPQEDKILIRTELSEIKSMLAVFLETQGDKEPPVEIDKTSAQGSGPDETKKPEPTITLAPTPP